MQQLLEGYLKPWWARVLVDGDHSAPMALEDEVFQGTVLGPPLWNVFFSDVDKAASANNATVVKFADDLSCFKLFPTTTANEEVLEDMLSTQAACHAWGRANQVKFDAGKEAFAVLHRRDGFGEDFKMLGT